MDRPCKVPRCYRDARGQCVHPDSMLVFQRSGLGDGLEPMDFVEAFSDFETALRRQFGNDEDAYNAYLCLRLRQPAWSWSRPPVQRYLTGLRNRMQQNRNHDDQDCGMDAPTLRFFKQFFAINIRRSGLTACDIVGMAIVRKCVSPGEAKFYTAQRAVATGTAGIVFEFLYKARDRRAVKMFIVEVASPQNLYVPAPRHNLHLSLYDDAVREFRMHQKILAIATPASTFRVLNVYGEVSQIRSQKKKTNVLAAYIMDFLIYPSLHEETARAPAGPLPDSILNKVGRMPFVLAELHEKGFAHSDLHLSNIAFPPTGDAASNVPYVIDFGRVVELSVLGRGYTRALYCALDYVLTLYMVLKYYKKFDRNKVMANVFLQSALAQQDLQSNMAILRDQAQASDVYDLIFEEVLTSRLVNTDVDVDCMVGIAYLLLFDKPLFFESKTFIDVAANGS